MPNVISHFRSKVGTLKSSDICKRIYLKKEHKKSSAKMTPANGRTNSVSCSAAYNAYNPIRITVEKKKEFMYL